MLNHSFHVVPNEFRIPSDGILGKDFIKNYRCNIDYNNMILSFYFKNKKLVIPILQGPEQDTIVLPARSEVIRKFTISNSNEPQIIDSQELEPGVFIARTIINPSQPFARVLNTTNETKILKNVNVKHENLSNYEIFSTDSVPKINERTGNLLKIIKGNSPNRFHNDLLPLCKEFGDVFALETDKMTVNNFYEQKLRLSDNTPVCNTPVSNTQRGNQFSGEKIIG